ncbi:sulfotransferase family protein [SAR92 clade bacterium H455]|uniref:Sulfotransferase family protein n=1 Tax=SAR92 clade bacterium H455 TaxID=2974818 RepID=A0ABY5TRZ1_9GAMM|nr:sulfotransferase family protein [SAR92 clade bacterium H455]
MEGFKLKMLRKLKDLIFMFRPELFEPAEYWEDPEYKVLYLVTSKCACTTIKHALYQGSKKMKFEGRDIHRDGKVKGQFRKNSVSSFDKKYDDYFKFTVVRSPSSRLVSTYFNKFVPYQNGKKSIIGFEFYGYHRSAFWPDMNFEEYLDAISSIDTRWMDRHIVPLDYYINQKAKFSGRVFKMGELGKLFDALSEIYGCQLTNPKINSSEKPTSAHVSLADQFVINDSRFARDLTEFGL